MLSHSLLPREAIKALREAASVPTDKDPNARAKAIDMAIDEVQRSFPEYFHHESN